MAFLAKGKKQDLRILATEMGENVTDNMKIIDLKGLIESSKKYEEAFVKELLEGIISDRKQEEEIEEQRRKEGIEEQRRREDREEQRRKEEIEEQRRKEEMEEQRRREDREEQKRKDELRAEELRLERVKLEASNNAPNNNSESKDRLTIPKFDIQKLMPKFDFKNDDITLYLALFERQAKIIQIPNEFLVAQLISLLPSDITAIIAREPEEEVTDYSCVKKLLLNRFKLSPESFRQLMARHQKKPDATWKDFCHEIKNYFEEWIAGLSVTTFEQLKDLMIVDQIKKRVPIEIKEHFVDVWANIVTPTELTTKLDGYENVRQNHKESSGQHMKNPPRKEGSWEKDKPQVFKSHQRSWDDNIRNTKYYRPPITYEAKGTKLICYRCNTEGHYAKNCTMKSKEKQGRIAETSQISSRNPVVEDNKDPKILTVKISVPVLSKETHIDTLESLNISCEGKKFKGIIDSGAQISVIRSDLIEISDDDSEGKIEIVSAFGEREIAPLRICLVKIDDGLHGEVPITCAISNKLVNDMLICRTAYDALNENVQLYERDTGIKHNTSTCFGLTLNNGSCIDSKCDEVSEENQSSSNKFELNEDLEDIFQENQSKSGTCSEKNVRPCTTLGEPSEDYYLESTFQENQSKSDICSEANVRPRTTFGAFSEYYYLEDTFQEDQSKSDNCLESNVHPRTTLEACSENYYLEYMFQADQSKSDNSKEQSDQSKSDNLINGRENIFHKSKETKSIREDGNKKTCTLSGSHLKSGQVEKSFGNSSEPKFKEQASAFNISKIDESNSNVAKLTKRSSTLKMHNIELEYRKGIGA